jgi:hypothetical protein
MTRVVRRVPRFILALAGRIREHEERLKCLEVRVRQD